MLRPDLRQEIEFLKARLLYKTKKLDEAMATTGGAERLEGLEDQIRQIKERLESCRKEEKNQDGSGAANGQLNVDE